MADLNKVFLMGRLTHDPELRYTTNGAAVSDLRLATTRTWSGKDGERREDSLFIDVTVWNRQAENCCQYLKKGQSVHVEGFLKMESWESPSGEKRSKVKIEADRVQFLDRRDTPSGGSSHSGGSMGGDDEYQAPREAVPRRSPAPASSGRSGAPPRPSPPPAPARHAPPPVDADADDDDIPF